MRFLDSKLDRGRLCILLFAGLLLGCALVWGLAHYFAPGNAFARTFDARFEWDAAHGFEVFQLKDDTQERAGGRVWQFIVGLQIKPVLASYLRRGRFNRASGDALIRVARIVPIALPYSWGSDGLSLDTDVTPLMRAADNADLDSVKKLLAEGADVNSKDWLGRTALLHACIHGNINPPVIKTLLAAGADVNARDKGGRTPLIAAVTVARGSDRAVIIRELLAAGASVNDKDKAGATALMQAAAAGDVQVVTLLLEMGADVSARSGTGETALSTAERYHQDQVIALLRRAETQR